VTFTVIKKSVKAVIGTLVRAVTRIPVIVLIILNLKLFQSQVSEKP
jgi:hypothetical protein